MAEQAPTRELEPDREAEAAVFSEPVDLVFFSVDERSATAPVTPVSRRGSDIKEETLAVHRTTDPQPPQEEGTTRTKWNRFALPAPILFIVALAIAIPLQSTELLLIGCAIACAAALIGARQCRDRGERGQGFAMAVIGFAMVGVMIATIALIPRL